MKLSFVTERSLVLAAGFAVLFLSGASRFAVGLTLRPMVEELGWSRSVVGLGVFVFQTVSAVSTFFAGRLVDKRSPKAVLGVGLCLSALGIGLMGFAAAPWQAFLLYGLIFGVGNGMTSTAPVGVMVTRVFAGRAGLANGFATSGLSAGQLIGIAVLSLVMAQTSWRWVFWLSGLAALAMIAPLVLATPGVAKGQAGRPKFVSEGMSLGESLRRSRFWLLIVIYAICGFNDFFVSTHLVAMAQDRGMEPVLAGELLALMGFTGLIGVLAAGAWGDRVGPVACTALSFVVRGLTFALVYFNRSNDATIVFALGFGATFMVTAPMTVLFVRENFGMRHLGSLTGVITMVHHMCGGFGAWLGAQMFDASQSYQKVFLIMIASTVVATAATMALGREGAPSFKRAEPI